MTQKTTGKAMIALSLTIIALIVVSVPVFAHHGTGISYDQDKKVTMKGIVTEFAWKNPHSQLYMDVKDENGSTFNYAVELNSPGVMIRQGWTRHQFKAGDEVTIAVHPSRVGGPVGECLNPCEVTINGKEPPK